MNRHVKHLLVAALIGAGLVTGIRVVAPVHHVEATAPAPIPVGSCC